MPSTSEGKTTRFAIAKFLTYKSMTDIEQIKEKIDIVEFIQGYLRLQKAGMNYRGLCPFHNEKTPSFMVSPGRQIWHCFGCNLGGDHFKFLMQIEGIEFPEALGILAKRAGVELKHFKKELSSEKNKLIEVSELAAKFFEKQLWESSNGKKALDYLRSRGLKDQTIKEWRLGFAPNTWNSLKKFLKDAGYKEEEIFKSGLSVKKQENLSSNYYDRFRGRIMFPISDINSQVVGFTGRIFEQISGEIESGKYVNTPQTLIYDKSRVLYGLDKAKMEIRKGNRVIVVEGNMDVIMSHQTGIKNVVASSGTALTAPQLIILKRYTQNLDLCFDEDPAGETAAKRGIDLALVRGFNVGIIKVGAKDPADLIKKDSSKWLEVSPKNQPIISFYLEKALQNHDVKTGIGKKNISKEVLPMIKLIENKIEQAHWLNELAAKLNIEQKILVQAMAQVINNREQRGDEEKQSVSFDSPSPATLSSGASRLAIEEALLALLLKIPDKVKEISPTGKDELEIFQDKFYNTIFGKLKLGESPHSLMSGGGEPPLSYEDKLRFELVKFKSEQFFGDLEAKDLETEISRLIKSLKKELILEKIKELEIKIKEAKSQKEIPPLLKEVHKFTSKLASL